MGDASIADVICKTENHPSVSRTGSILIDRCAQQGFVLGAGSLMFSHNLDCLFSGAGRRE